VFSRRVASDYVENPTTASWVESAISGMRPGSIRFELHDAKSFRDMQVPDPRRIRRAGIEVTMEGGWIKVVSADRR